MALAPRYFRKMATQTKIETTYGVDSTPAAGDNILMSNVSFRPLLAQRLQRDLILPWLGNQGVILAGYYATIEGDIEIAGSGAAGTPPKWGVIPRIAGMAETITAATKVEYTRVGDDAGDSASVYFVMDKVRHVLLGARANLAPNLASPGIGKMRASITGLLGTVSDIGSNPAVSKTGWTKPVPVSKDNTVVTLHGWTVVGESLSLNMGNVVTPAFLIGDELISITDISAVGTLVARATALSTIDLFAKAKSRATGSLSVVHGTVAGNIVEFTAPNVEIGEPEPNNSNGFLNYSIPLDLCANTANDDFKITVR